jgi:hypothetical protein
MTVETLKEGMRIFGKMQVAKGQITTNMQKEAWSKDVLKKEYFANKVFEWTEKLDALREELKKL